MNTFLLTKRGRIFLMQNLIESYEEIDEEHRLQSSLARRVEFISTVEALTPFCFSKMKILDVGCGTGIYSLYFSKKGADVTAIDLVPKHIRRLEELINKEKLSIDSYVGNAVDLSRFDDESFDMVLCLGPLYHLISSDDRQKCLNECIRVTKAKGIIAFAYISPYSVFPCVLRGNLSRISKELMKKIVDDKKISSDDSCCFWTDNYFYSPDDIEIWLKNNDLIIEDHLASDGQSIAFQTVVNSMNDSEFEIWFEYHRKTCRIPSLLGASNHGLIITRKKV